MSPRTLYRLLTYSCIGLLLINGLYGQSFLFSKINTSHGLSDNNARTITIDKNGFLWIGTSQGLNVYDGYSVTTFLKEHNPELAGDLILEVKSDSKNRVWIGTPEGTSWLDKNRRFHRVTLEDTLKKFYCPSIFETDVYGTVIFTDKGQFYYDSSKGKWQEIGWIPAPIKRLFLDAEKFSEDKVIFSMDTLVAILDYRKRKILYQAPFRFPVSACKLK